MCENPLQVQVPPTSVEGSVLSLCVHVLMCCLSNRTASQTLRPSSTSCSCSSRPRCSRSAWRRSSSTTAGSSARTGPHWVGGLVGRWAGGLVLGSPCVWLFFFFLCVSSEAVRAPVFRHGTDKNGFSLGISKNFRQVFGDEVKYWPVPVFSR